MSDKLPQMMSLESVGPEHYKFENVKKNLGVQSLKEITLPDNCSLCSLISAFSPF